MVAAAPRSSGGLAAQGRAGLRHQSPERVETRCWCLSDAWRWPSLAKTAHSSERSRTHCAVGGTERPVPHAKCLGVLLWGPEAAGLQWAPWPAPEAGPGAARRGVLLAGRALAGPQRADGPHSSCLGAHGVHCFPGAGSLCATPVSQGGKEPTRRSLRSSGTVSPLTPCQCVSVCARTQSLCSADPRGGGGG